jgi:hydroxymethylpyrimidine pyrophosphatase-like HAD family hydrolase
MFSDARLRPFVGRAQHFVLIDDHTLRTERALSRPAVAQPRGPQLILMTGRTLDDSELSLFDLVVTENGAVLFDPALGSQEPLCASPPARDTASQEDLAVIGFVQFPQAYSQLRT